MIIDHEIDTGITSLLAFLYRNRYNKQRIIQKILHVLLATSFQKGDLHAEKDRQLFENRTCICCFLYICSFRVYLSVYPVADRFQHFALDYGK